MSEGVGSGIPGDETQDGAGADGGRTEQDDAQQAEVEQDEAEQDDGAPQQSGDVEEQAGDVEPSDSEPGDATVVPVVPAEAEIPESAHAQTAVLPTAPPPAPYEPVPFAAAPNAPAGQPYTAFGEPVAKPTIAGLPRRGVIAAAGAIGVAALGGIVAAMAGSGGGSGGGTNTAGGSGGSGSGKTNANGGAAAGGSSPSPSATFPAPKLSTVPSNGASDVDPSKPVTVTVADGVIASVQLSGGQETSGTMSGDKSSWTSNGVLSLDASYQLQVEVTGRDGKNATHTVSFSTLKPSATIGVLEMWPGDGMSVGVGQPIRVQFTNYVPQSYRAAVEKACVVTTTPAVAGAWHWVATDTMDWRPQDYWKTGTQVKAAFDLAGVRAGAHQFFVKSHSLDFAIRDTDLRLVVDTKRFKATAYQNGKQVRSFPIDTGSNDPRFITWSGTLAVLGKGNPVEMKGDYGNGDKYDEFVNWATQITYSGTYVHAAPWDGQIGEVNSSHGCIHASTANATWFYNLAHVGDVVEVTGTNKTVAVTNGFGDWTLSWSAWLSGSAYGATLGGLPVSG